MTDLGDRGRKLDPKWLRALREMVAPDLAETAERIGRDALELGGRLSWAVSLLRPQQLEHLQAELTPLFGPHQLIPARHINQRNETWLLRSERGDAVVKLYRCLSHDALTGIIEAEERARGAGLPVPAVLYRSARWPLIVYAYVHGTHQIPGDPALINICAELFVRQLGALRGFRPTWTPIRPDGLPRRAQEAINNCSDNQLRETIRASWQQLSRLACDQEAASHVDWRADNILFLNGQVAAVLDWEDVVLLPSAEAVGYGAGSLTHSWREALYRPLALPAVMWFLEAAGSRLAREPGSPGAAHARLAAFFTCAVRLAEDQQRGAATIAYDDLRASLGG
jgi:hypothetical protein